MLWRRVLSVDAPAPQDLVLLAIALAGFLYLTAGVSQALADSRDVVGLRAALRAGVKCYGAFLWMIAKLVLLSGVLLNVAAYLATGGNPAGSSALSHSMPGVIPVAQGVLSFVFVYWLPNVFVRGNFALFKTLRDALVIWRQRLAFAGFLAGLTLTPSVVAVLAGDSVPLVLVLLINLVGGVMEWIAYAYCVGYLQARADR